MKMQLEPNSHPLGYTYLVRQFELDVCSLLCEAWSTERSTKATVQADLAERTFYPSRRYVIDSGWQGQVVFALKYEGVNIEVLRALFEKLSVNEVSCFVAEHPLGVFSRKVGFLYEFLTEQKLDVPSVNAGGYVTLIDDDLQYALPTEFSPRERRYRIINNLIGNRNFSPYIRKSAVLRNCSHRTLKALSDSLVAQYPSEIIYRAIQYLYIKETKSSFAIERETPDQKRMEAFVGLLRNIADVPITKEALITAQNAIVDKRYRQLDWRTDQVYVGQTITPEYEKIHYIAPRPDAVNELMDGFLKCTEAWLTADEQDPILVAAVLSFAFVFLHPFDDGNGRIHRYLMHLILSRLGFVPKGLIFPVSAVMLQNQAQYDAVLETFSQRLMPHLDFKMDANGEVCVQNDSRSLYRAIDFTPFVTYFYTVVEETIRTEWKAELDYLKHYDQMRAAMRKIVDMPDKKANQFIIYVRQNGGHLSERKRHQFAELTGEEISRLESVINNILPSQPYNL